MRGRFNHWQALVAAVVGVALVLLAAACGETSGPEQLRGQAIRFRHHLRHGEALGGLSIPRLHRTIAIQVGWDQATLARGPGWYPRSSLPGEHKLVYIVGHRRTHGGPFRRLGELVPGDRIVITTPYATTTYAVAGHFLFSERDLSVLRSPRHEVLRLQTSTVPPGHQRLLVYARPVSVRARRP